MRAIWADNLSGIKNRLDSQRQPYGVAICDIDFLLRFCKRFSSDDIHLIMTNIEKFLADRTAGDGILKQSNHDEFLILIKNITKKQLHEKINAIRLQFRRQRFASGCRTELSNIVMTFSAGIASFPVDGKDFDEVFKRATVALYLAKSRRRNCVVSYPETAAPDQGAETTKDERIKIEFGKYGVAGFVEGTAEARNALLWEPQAVDTDEDGNLYIIDQNNHCLLKYDGSCISRIAGSGGYGYAGDGGNALEATLNKPTGLSAFGESVYITDTGNDAVRRYDRRTGRIETIAGNGTAGYTGDGGRATAARLNKPGGVALDGAGNIYINDIANNVIRKVNSKGIITTFAGTGGYGYTGDGGQAAEATFAEIYGIAADRQTGELLIADYYNHCIRAVSFATGIISTVAGKGSAGFSPDGATIRGMYFNRPVAVCTDNRSSIYVADSGNSCVWRLRKDTGRAYRIAGDGRCGTGEAEGSGCFRLANPNGVAADNHGKLFILDGANNRVCSVFI